MKDKSSLDTDEHSRLAEFVVSVYGKSRRNIFVLIVINYLTNKAFDGRMIAVFMSRSSQLFNLAMRML